MKKISTLFSAVLFSMAFGQIPTGYYDGTDGLTGAALKTKLSQIISAGTQDKGYDGLYTAYPSTDSDKFYENDGSILDMYSENPSGMDPYNYLHGQKKCGNYSAEGDCYNREHVVPQSLFGSQAPMVSDIHHIRPTDGKVNGMRSNYPFGKVNSPSFTSKNGSKLGPNVTAGYTGTAFEPIDEFKGDIARMIFYFVTRYEDKLSTFSTGNILGGSPYPGLQIWERDVLIAWHMQDPVSPSEEKRNDASFTYQGNRNPFIDKPEWVNKVWGTASTDTQALSAPTNLQVSSTAVSSVNLTWSAATDDVAVSYYKVYANGQFQMSTTTNAVTVLGLTQGTTYNFYVVALDAAGNVSAQSNTVSGTTSTDNIAPTAPTGLTATFEGTNNVTIQWNASTDNIGVSSYDIYVNGAVVGSSSTTSTNVGNLNPSTTYTIYVVAKDATGNSSPASNTITATTNAVGQYCGTENFQSIPASASSYSTYNWTSNGISWTSVDSRTDQLINDRAITIRNGSLTALSAPNGIGDLTVTTQLKFSGSAGNLKVFVNGVDTGKTIPYSATVTTTTVTGINISGNVEITLENLGSSNRVAIDDMRWTCYYTASTGENGNRKNNFSVFPNPVRNGELNVKGQNLSTISVAHIFDFTGKLVQTVQQPFKNSSKIILQNLPKGIYLLKVDELTTKFIVN